MLGHSIDGTIEPSQPSAPEVVDIRSEATGTVMARLRAALEKVQQVELERLYDRLPKLNEQTRREIHQFSERLVAKVLDPPSKSLGEELGDRPQQALLDSLQRLFQLPPIN
jgi:glutamyl-tRNA reductase